MNQIEILSQNSAPGLLRNGNFSHGLAHWYGSYVTHNQGSFPQNTAAAPYYDVTLVRPGSGGLIKTQGPGIWQYLDRPDLATFPSTRGVTGLEFIPYSPTKAILRVVEGLTAVDGRVLTQVTPADLSIPVNKYSTELLFQHPFVHTGLVPLRGTAGTKRQDYEVRTQPGDPLPVTDTLNNINSAVFRVGRVLENYTGTAQPPATAEMVDGVPVFDLHLYSYHGLEVVRVSGTNVAIFDHTFDEVSNTEIEVVGGVTRVTITAPRSVVEGLDRQQPGLVGVGLKDGDVFTVVAPKAGSGVITNLVIGESQTTFELAPLTNYGVVVTTTLTNQAQNPVTEWYVYPPSTANATRTLPLHKYEITTAVTYLGSKPRPEAPSLEFRTLEPDGSIDGFGRIKDVIKADLTTARDILIADAALSIRRLVSRISREYTTPQTGRVGLRVQPQLSLGTPVDAVVTQIRAVATNFAPPLFAQFRLEFNTPITAVPTSLAPGTLIKLQSTPNEWVGKDWIANVFAEELLTIAEVEYLDEGANGVVLVRFAYDAAWGAYNDSANNPWPGLGTINEFAQLIPVAAGALETTIGDVFAVKGDFTARIAATTDAALPPSNVLNDQVAVDPLIHQIDLLDNIIPMGTVMLYAGGGVCPPGFKRLEGFANSTETDVVSLPFDVTTQVAYDPEVDRTTITYFDQTFPVLDAAGEPVTQVANFITQSLPIESTGQFETVTLPVYQQLMQPGMQLRHKGTSVTAEELEQAKLLPVQGLAFRAHVQGQQPNSGNPFITLPIAATPRAEWDVEVWFKYSKPTFDSSRAHVIINSVTYETPATPTTSPPTGFLLRILPDKSLQAIAFIRFGSTYSAATCTLGNPASASTTIDWELGEQGVSNGPATGWYQVLLRVRSGSTAQPNFPIDMQLNGATKNLLASTKVQTSPTTAGVGSMIPLNVPVTTWEGTQYQYKHLALGVGWPALSSSFANPALGSDVDIDTLRVFLPTTDFLSTAKTDSLYNGGLGSAVLPADYPEPDTCVGEFRLDGVVGTSLLNTAPNMTPPGNIPVLGSVVGALFPATPGFHQIVLSDNVVTEAGYRAALEAEDPAYLITDVDTVVTQFVGNKPSATAANPNPAPGVAGKGVVTYPSYIGIYSANPADVAVGSDPFPPLGPGPAEQLETFSDNKPVILWLKQELDIVNGLPLGFRAGTDQDANGNVIWLPQSSSTWPYSVGDVLWASYSTTVGGPTGALVRLVDAYFIEDLDIFGQATGDITAMFAFESYNKRPLPKSLGQINSNITLRPAKLYGVGTQTADATGAPTANEVIQTQVQLDTGQRVWVTRVIEQDTVITVQGELAPNPEVVNTLKVEAGGYVRYDEPDTAMDYGAGGHSHQVLNAQGIPIGPVLPRVEEGTAFAAATPFTAVASGHGHGFLSTYRYPLPFCRIVTLCQRL